MTIGTVAGGFVIASQTATTIIMMDSKTFTVSTISILPPQEAIVASTDGSTATITIFITTGPILTMAATIAGGRGAGIKGNLAGGMATGAGMIKDIIHDDTTTVVAIIPRGEGNDSPI